MMDSNHYDDTPNPFRNDDDQDDVVHTPSVADLSFNDGNSSSDGNSNPHMSRSQEDIDEEDDQEGSHSTLNKTVTENQQNHSFNSQPESPAAGAPGQGPTSPIATRTFPSYYAQANPNKDEFCCGRDQFLHSADAEILITDAVKTSEGSTSPYIAYVIRTGHIEARRRYSEFESLRTGLMKLYPTLIIPPIPSKQSIGDYAVKQAKAKEDATMIARRKRMLQTFLNRIAKHPILSNEHVFHRFLDRDVSWSEVLNSPPLSLVPKNILKAPAYNPTDTDMAIYSALPNPPASQPLRHPDQRFLDSETFTNKFASHLSGNMEKVTRRTMKRWADFSHDHAELGATLNGFSLTEEDALAAALEKTGQAVDATYISTAQLLQEFERRWTEPLHEYSQFAQIIKRLLVYRHQKHVQYEMTQDTLESKRDALEEHERVEAEAARLEQALSRSQIIKRPENSAQGDNGDGLGHSSYASRGSRSVPPSTTRSSVENSIRPRKSGYGLFSALSYSLQGIIDVDPETARRSNISKTRDGISQLEDALHASAQDLKYASSTIQADLDRFQRQKVADLREMTIELAKMHREWCKQNLEAWIAAKKEIDKIPLHPNQVRANEHAEALRAEAEAAKALQERENEPPMSPTVEEAANVALPIASPTSPNGIQDPLDV